MSIPKQIQLVLRTGIGGKGSALTWGELDGNFTALRSAILGLAETVGAGRVVIGAEPPVGERDGVVWIPTAGELGIFYWDKVNAKWVRVTDPVLYATSGGTNTAYTLSLSRTFADYAAMAGYPIVVKIHATCGASPTLNINGLGAKSLKKLVSSGVTSVEADDMKIDGLYVVVYGGSDFQLLNPTPKTLTTGPVFITKQTVYSGSDKDWTTYDATDYVDAKAKAVILEAYGTQTTADDGSAQVEIRRDLAGETYILDAIGSVDGVRSGGQGIFPMTGDCKFDFRVLNNNPGIFDVTYLIKLVGYIM